MSKYCFDKVVVIVAFSLFSFGANAQNIKKELGFGVGVLNYTGDLARRYRFLTQRPGATVYYKYNMSKAVNFRASITAGRIVGNDNRPIDAFALMRDSVVASAFKVFVFEISTVFEYNFMDLKGRNPLIFGTPYLFGGIGVSGFSSAQEKMAEYSPVQPVLPFGFGVKYVANPKWYLSLEFGARWLFFDYLDNISFGDRRYKNYQYGNWYDNDIYYFLGFTATYSFYDIPCPVNPYR